MWARKLDRHSIAKSARQITLWHDGDEWRRSQVGRGLLEIYELIDDCQHLQRVVRPG
jgi:hypothetical protein